MLTTLLLLVVLGLAAYIAWQKFGARPAAPGDAASAPASVRLYRVTAQRTGGSGPVLTATGKIVSDHQVEVSTKVSGQIVALYFEQGDFVEQGQVLAAIDDVLPRARRDEAAANLAKARANLEYQTFNVTRVERLYHDKQASDIEFADAKRAAEEATAQVAADEATLAYTDKVLRDCRVEAPITGVILARNVEVGDFVAAEGGRGAMANSQFGTIADMSKLRVEVDVSELDVGRIRRDMPCVVTPDAHKDRHYNGWVMWIDPGANYAKATVQVKVRIDNPDPHLRVEGAAQVQFLGGSADSAPSSQAAGGLWVPSAACRPGGAASTAQVFVVANGRFKATPVTLGRRDGDQVEITSGLAEGQEIAADGIEQLKDGQPAR